MDLHLLPLLWQDLARSLAALLHQRAAWRLLAHLPSCCLASSSPRAAAWLPAGCGLRRQPTTPPTTTFLSALGRRADLLAGVLLQHALRHVAPAGPLLFARDDTLTPRYGPHVQGAGVHHNPTPGPTDQRFVYGHVWVSLAGVAWHSLWGAIALPLRALLYVRAKDMPRVPRRYRWVFRTKLALAADLVGWATRWARVLGRAVRVVADGFYAKRPFLRAAARAGITVISRLRREAALRPLPRRPPADHRRRGRPAVYGSGRISLAKRAGQRRGWQLVPARQYGKVRAKTSKTFLATWRPAGGRIRVVLVREPHGWLTLFSTDVSLTAEEILSAAADRFSIEQDFHDLKEVEGLGQQQVRDIWAHVGAFPVNAWVHVLIELWAWGQPKEAICDRNASPWDTAERRPSHADRRKALQRQCLGAEFLTLAAGQALTPEIQEFVGRVIRHAA